MNKWSFITFIILVICCICEVSNVQKDLILKQQQTLIKNTNQIEYQYISQGFQSSSNLLKSQNKQWKSNKHLKYNNQIIQLEQIQHSHYLKPSQGQFWLNILIAIILTCIGGFCSGMTVGLMSIQTIHLQVMEMGGTPQQKKIAKRILDVVTNHHLFLVTLLLANAMALQTLPLVVHTLMPDWAAIIFSTFIVLVVGQIVPQAYCTGSKKITIAYWACPIIKIMIKVLWILAYPMSKGLDYLLGIHDHQRIQHKDFANFLKGETKSLKTSQIFLLTSILQLRCNRVTDIMIPINKLYMLNMHQKLTQQKVKQISQKDYSYIFVYRERKQNIVGLIKIKQFALKYLKFGNKPILVKDIYKEYQNFLSVYADTNLLQMLMLFQAKSYRIALVSNKYKKTVPGMKSIMYSKSDMVVQQNQVDILGAVFLYSIFEVIANFNQNMEKKRVSKINKMEHEQEMTQIKFPLVKNQH